jgi:hypothetical protein
MPSQSATLVMPRPAKGMRPKKLRPAMAETRPRIKLGARSCTTVLARPMSVETLSESRTRHGAATAN